MADTSSQGTNLFPLTVQGGQTVRVMLGAPAMGLIMKFSVIQLNADGTLITSNNLLSGFSYTFYDAAVACPPGVTQTSTEPTVNAAIEAQHQIMPTKVAASNNDRVELADGSDGTYSQIGIPYINRDGSLSSAQPKLYMKLTVLGTGTKTFGIFMGIQHYRG
jgi:hypothetical protein